MFILWIILSYLELNSRQIRFSAWLTRLWQASTAWPHSSILYTSDLVLNYGDCKIISSTFENHQCDVTSATKILYVLPGLYALGLWHAHAYSDMCLKSFTLLLQRSLSNHSTHTRATSLIPSKKCWTFGAGLDKCYNLGVGDINDIRQKLYKFGQR